MIAILSAALVGYPLALWLCRVVREFRGGNPRVLERKGWQYWTLAGSWMTRRAH